MFELITIAVLLAVLAIAAEVYARRRLAKVEMTAQDAKESFFERIWPAHVRYHAYRAALDYRYIRLFTPDPKRARWPHYRFDQRGFRLDRHDVRIEAPGAEKTIWMFGNSTLTGLGCREDETIPAYLNDALSAAAAPYRVLNLGVGGMSSTQELLLLIELVHAGYRPDAIVVYDGIIDQAKAHWMRGAPQSWQDWQRGTGLADAVRQLEHVATMSDADYMRRIARDAWTLLRGRLALPRLVRPGKSAQPSARPTAGGDWTLVVRRYLENLNMIGAVAAWLRIPAQFYFQPLLAYEEHYRLRKLALSEQEILRLAYTDEHLRRDTLYRRDLEPLRTSLGDRFVDLYDIFRGRDGETLYGDPRHPNAAGNALIAGAIYADLERRLDLAAPALPMALAH